MRVLIILDHPWDKSLCHAMADALQTGLRASHHEVDMLDLHAEEFDPVMRREELALYSRGQFLDPKVSEYQSRVKQAQHIAFVFPVWWEVMPAMLKGWLDKVLLPGFAFRESDASPLLTHLTGATAITTMGAPEITYNSVESALLKGTMGFCGVKHTRYINYLDVGQVSADQRAEWLAEIETYGRELS